MISHKTRIGCARLGLPDYKHETLCICTGWLAASHICLWPGEQLLWLARHLPSLGELHSCWHTSHTFAPQDRVSLFLVAPFTRSWLPAWLVSSVQDECQSHESWVEDGSNRGMGLINQVNNHLLSSQLLKPKNNYNNNKKQDQFIIVEIGLVKCTSNKLYTQMH